MSTRGKNVEKALGQLKRKQEKLQQALAQLGRGQEGHAGSKPLKDVYRKFQISFTRWITFSWCWMAFRWH